MNRLLTFGFAMSLAACRTVTAAALDEIKIDVSHELCQGVAGLDDGSVVVYATNLSSNRTIDATFKYDSNPAHQRFILFDASLNPITDRFPKLHTRRVVPHETVEIGCTYTYRAAPQPPGPFKVPIVITKQGASYVDANSAEMPPEDARSFAAFILQGGINECGAGAKPPGLFYFVNLHPYARLSASIDLLDEHGTHVGALTSTLSPLSAARVACSNGSSKPAPITSATLEVSAGAAAEMPAAPRPEAKPVLPENREESSTLPPLPLGAMLRTQHVCAGSVPSGWIKINDAWNPTVCGNPAAVAYNVWILQQLSDQPPGAIIHACSGTVPAGWALVGTVWNPTVCGHPLSNQSNVMAIKRLN